MSDKTQRCTKESRTQFFYLPNKSPSHPFKLLWPFLLVLKLSLCTFQVIQLPNIADKIAHMLTSFIICFVIFKISLNNKHHCIYTHHFYFEGILCKMFDVVHSVIHNIFQFENRKIKEMTVKVRNNKKRQPEILLTTQSQLHNCVLLGQYI